MVGSFKRMVVVLKAVLISSKCVCYLCLVVVSYYCVSHDVLILLYDMMHWPLRA